MMGRNGKCRQYGSKGLALGARPGYCLVLSLCILGCFLAPGLFCSAAFGGTIYSYVDENGVYHFTNAPTDSRFTRVDIKENSAVLKGRGRRNLYGSRGLSGRDVQARIDLFKREIARAAGFFGLDPALIKAIIRAESGGDPHAVSSKGAQGLMQLMPETARELMVYNPFDPAENIWGGSKYFSWLMENFDGDVIAALAAYNSGPGTVERYGGVPPYPETIQYIKRVLRFWKQAKKQS